MSAGNPEFQLKAAKLPCVSLLWDTSKGCQTNIYSIWAIVRFISTAMLKHHESFTPTWWVRDLQICCQSQDLAAVCPHLQVSSPVRSFHWLELLAVGSLSVDSAAQHRRLWGTPSLESQRRWRTARHPAQTAGFLKDRNRYKFSQTRC